MSDFLTFILAASEQIGLVPALVIAALVALGGYMFRLNTKKEKMLQEIIKKQEAHSALTLEAIKVAVEGTKSVTESSMKELIRLSSKIEGIVEITKMLLMEQKEREKESEKGGE